MRFLFSCPRGAERSHLPRLPILGALLVVVWGSVAWARVGESEAELTKRFGFPREVEGSLLFGLSDKDLIFHKGGIDILVCIKDGRSVSELYTFSSLARDEKIEGELLKQAAAIVELNAGGHTWTKHPNPSRENPNILHFWMRSDLRLFAMIRSEVPNALQVCDMAIQEEVERQAKAAEAGLDGL
jgi:hypothetical protein